MTSETKSKYWGQNKKFLYAEAKKRGMDVTWRTGKDKLQSMLELDDAERKLEQKLISPEDLIRAEDKPSSQPSKKSSKKAKKKFKQVEVTYFGPNGTLRHHPPAQPYHIAFRRGVAMNLYKELWRCARALKEDPKLLDHYYKIYADYYKKKASEPGSDWHVKEAVLGFPIKERNKAGLTFSMEMKEVMGRDWEQVIAQLKAWKRGDDEPPRPYVEIITNALNLELDGRNRVTLRQWLEEELRGPTRDARQRVTSE